MERLEKPIVLIKRIREIRKKAEKLNPLYNLSECKTCGPVDEVLEELEKLLKEIREKKEGEAAGHPSFNPEEYLNMEREMAEKLIRDLSEKYGVEPPKLIISDRCHEPDQAFYDPNRKAIMVCKTGVNLHVLAHEFWHHIQRVKGMHLDEREAENFAVNLFRDEKGLYPIKAHNHNGMMTLRDVLVIYGGQHVGEGIRRLLLWCDAQKPEGIYGVKISLIGDVIGTIGGVAGALYLRPPYDMLMALIGGHLSTDLWRHAEAAMAPAARFVAAPAAAPPAATMTVKPSEEVATVSKAKF